MTRINVVPVWELSDEHLKAEYFELPRLYPLVEKAFQKDRDPRAHDLPATYRLGVGHMRFFYDKLGYLTQRHRALGCEARHRGVEVAVDPGVHFRFLDVVTLVQLPPRWWLDYEPTEEDMFLNRSRLQERKRYAGGVYDHVPHPVS